MKAQYIISKEEVDELKERLKTLTFIAQASHLAREPRDAQLSIAKAEGFAEALVILGIMSEKDKDDMWS